MRHDCAIICATEEDDGANLSIIFEGAQAYKCTYYKAISLEMRDKTYDALVDVGESDWLAAVIKEIGENDEDASGLRHLMIYLDDGPCYEIICKTFRIEDSADGNWSKT